MKDRIEDMKNSLEERKLDIKNNQAMLMQRTEANLLDRNCTQIQEARRSTNQMNQRKLENAKFITDQRI